MCATIVLTIVMINMQVENLSPLIDIFEIESEAIELLSFF